MEIMKGNAPSRILKYWQIVKNGLFVFGLRNRLALIGIDINPYYWVEEEFKRCSVPVVKDDISKYTLKNLTFNQIKSVIKQDVSNQNAVIEGLDNSQLCIGLEKNGEIACYTFIELNDFDYKGRFFKLKPNEAYLFNMWTFHNYRGKNLAPYLRYQAYRILEERGVDVKYSISQYFNKSSIKFKKKLSSKHHYLYLSIVIFKKIKWNFTLKRYDV